MRPTFFDPAAVKRLNSSLGKQFFKFEVGLDKRSQNLSWYIKEQVRVLDRTTNGGIKAYTQFMGEAGRLSKIAKAGGWLAIGIDAAGGVKNIIAAHKEGKTVYRRAVITETSKVVGSAVGGAVGAEIGAGLVAGLIVSGTIVATGGMALVVIGIGAVIVGGAGSILGKMGGASLGDEINDSDLGDGIGVGTDKIHELFD